MSKVSDAASSLNVVCGEVHGAMVVAASDIVRDPGTGIGAGRTAFSPRLPDRISERLFARRGRLSPSDPFHEGES